MTGKGLISSSGKIGAGIMSTFMSLHLQHRPYVESYCYQKHSFAQSGVLALFSTSLIIAPSQKHCSVYTCSHQFNLFSTSLITAPPWLQEVMSELVNMSSRGR